MGIKGLWNLLTPYSERKPLFELSNRAVAIDLSGWVCESLNVVDYFVHPRFYLRNLFFRTCYLLQTGIIPVFVLDGTAPPLKYGVIVKRNQLQFRGARPRKVANCDKQNASAGDNKGGSKQPSEQKRKCFHRVLKECEELLSAMGLVCVQAPGEAEALCACLNRDDLVYGVVSQDSDCFAYGARRVFKNFSASANGGSVEIYDLNRMHEGLRIGQEKTIAMALLAGCDYNPTGVVGVGQQLITRFLNCYEDDKVLARLRSWRRAAERLTELEIKADDKDVCPDCGHRGKLRKHQMNGCSECRTGVGCDEKRWKTQRANIRAELDIRYKALKDPDFPHEPIIEEFLAKACELPQLFLDWKQPNLIKFTQSIATSLQWDVIYCFQKFLPLLTRWQIYSLSRAPDRALAVCLEPDYIKKKRTPKGVASYEIIWKDEKKLFDSLLPDDQISAFLSEPGNTLENLWSTIEPQDLTAIAYPALVDSFAVKHPTKRKKKKTNEQPKTQPKRKVNKKATTDAKQPVLDAFLTKGKSGPSSKDSKAIAKSDRQLQFLLETTAELEDLINDSATDSALDVSGIIHRVLDPDYYKTSLEKYSAAIDQHDRQAAFQELLSCSVLDVSTIPTMDDEPQENGYVQHRLVLKQDLLNASVADANQSLAFHPKNRSSYFFEPLDIPPPEMQDECHAMDMFECSLMLKDQVVLVDNVEGCRNQTIIYDIDF